MTNIRPLNIRLEPSRHDVAKERAAAAGSSIADMMGGLLETYAAGPVPEPVAKAPARDSLLRTQLWLPTEVRERIETRAKAEGRSVSQVVSALLDS